jgi:hypothetical protein
MKKAIFYSWQSDLSNSTNRTFIEDVLEKAAAVIAADVSIEVEPVIDRDTQGAPGSRGISKTIFEKIANCAIFVADVSIIGSVPNKKEGKEDRPTPNPNVLVELGYALRALDDDRVVLVMNEMFGKPELLPFDLRMRQTVRYSAREGADNATAKRLLQRALEEQIRLILRLEPSEESLLDHIVEAVEAQTAGRITAIRKYMVSVSQSLDKIYPGPANQQADYETILAMALTGTKGLVADFAKVVEVSAIADDAKVLDEIFKGFKPILDHYYLPANFSGGQYDSRDFDFYKFIGDDLLVTMIAVLIRERKWQLVKRVLNNRIIVDNLKGGQAGSVGFEYFSHHAIYSFGFRDGATGQPPRARLLAERHSSSPANEVVSLDDYLAADYFLFLRYKSTGMGDFEWNPWSTAYMKRPPQFLIEAERKKDAEGIADALGGRDIPSLQHIVNACSPLLVGLLGSHWDNPITNQLVAKIGTMTL